MSTTEVHAKAMVYARGRNKENMLLCALQYSSICFFTSCPPYHSLTFPETWDWMKSPVCPFSATGFPSSYYWTYKRETVCLHIWIENISLMWNWAASVLSHPQHCHKGWHAVGTWWSMYKSDDSVSSEAVALGESWTHNRYVHLQTCQSPSISGWFIALFLWNSLAILNTNS